MTGLLALIVVILFVVTIWQMSKIFKLSQLKGTGENSQIANDKDNRINGKLMIMFLIFMYFITIYCFWYYSKFYLTRSIF